MKNQNGFNLHWKSHGVPWFMSAFLKRRNRYFGEYQAAYKEYRKSAFQLQNIVCCCYIWVQSTEDKFVINSDLCYKSIKMMDFAFSKFSILMGYKYKMF